MAFDERLRAYLETRNTHGPVDPQAVDVAQYALETNLRAFDAEGRVRTTALGRTFLRLRGKDAVRWLLTIETEQSRGENDPWRMPAELLAEAMTSKGLHHVDATMVYEIDAIERAVALGVLRRRAASPDGEHYTVVGAMRDVVHAVVERGPWHAAVAAQLDDERNAAIGIAATTASDATVEQTRMITHEVRNALTPVRLHLDDILAAELAPKVRPRAEAARRGVIRVLDFVGQIVNLAEMMTEPLVSAELAPLLGEAAAEAGDTGQVALASLATRERVHVPKTRFVTALTNVIRNALQSATPPPKVRIVAVRVGDLVRIQIDDAGPGVPPDDRARVFDDGFTTKPGGSGFGLAYVKHVIEKDLRGRIWCEASDLGGARFVLEIPAQIDP